MPVGSSSRSTRLPVELADGQAERSASGIGPARPGADVGRRGVGRSRARPAARRASRRSSARGRRARPAARAAVPGARAAISRISSSSFADGLAVDGDDDVVRPQAGALARRPRRDVLDERAVADRQLQRAAADRHRRRAARRRCSRATRARARAAAAGSPSRRLIGTAKPMLLRARADRGVDADDLAARVDERPAAVAEVDRRVGLDVVVEARVEQLAADEADDADRDACARSRAGCRSRTTHSPTRSVDGVAERRHRQPASAPSTLISAMSVSGSAPIDARAKRAAVGQLDGDALGAVDDVMVREDAAVGVDDEAAAGAAPRRVALAAAGRGRSVRRTDPARSGSARFRRLRGSRPRVVASMLTTAGLMRSTTSAKLIERRGSRRTRDRRRGPDGGALGDRRRRPPTTAARATAGDDRPDEERHDGGEREGDEGEAARTLQV